MTVKGCILNLIEKNYNGKLRTVVIVRIGTYINKNQNNELAIFFNENKKHLLSVVDGFIQALKFKNIAAL